MKTRIKIILEKIKITLTTNEAKSLFVFIEHFLGDEIQKGHEVDFLQMAWIGLLKQIAVKIIGNDLEDDSKKIKLSISESQYMALMELRAIPIPHPSYQIAISSVYAALFKVGMDKELINIKNKEVVPFNLLTAHNSMLNPGE